LDVKHLQPGTDTGVLVEEKAKKRKRGMGTEDKVEDGELPMEERLTNLTITTSTSGIRENNLAHLLSQARATPVYVERVLISCGKNKAI